MAIFLFIVLSFLLMSPSCSDPIKGEMKVVKDCTGSYLRINDKDFLICNEELVEQYENESEVTASFIKVDSCPQARGRVVCYMLHENEGWIEIQKIK